MILPEWNAPARVRALSSVREGGVSTGCYESLNLGMHVGDSPEDVLFNRQIIRTKASMPGEPLWLNQTHSNRVVHVDRHPGAIIDADGVFTETPGVVCAVMTADCLPVLMTNAVGNQVAAVHAGWRGLADGILENSCRFFSGEIIAWMGPAIGKDAFEVGEDVVEAFTSFDGEAIKAFKPHTHHQGKWLADLALLATQRFNRQGVTAVFHSNQCTFSHSGRYFSYRRDGVTGRQASFIWFI
ncbi:Laccase domain protein YfiH [Vibrio aerogenes CECT 7868]|uniref:Purine nucleoside phosphorylase n=1 Tax=Vibrio aerogenes CECT 7868 TaxID=1216006 RepID=A0A1M5Y6H6_9VIBR|nr:peptidoglycan editing factor PgeF [Vibrio aerogenes]SHI07691.1 Laccase domain protein YfiH [Vibrio aerogenes CECT 7868]